MPLRRFMMNGWRCSTSRRIPTQENAAPRRDQDTTWRPKPRDLEQSRPRHGLLEAVPSLLPRRAPVSPLTRSGVALVPCACHRDSGSTLRALHTRPRLSRPRPNSARSVWSASSLLVLCGRRAGAGGLSKVERRKDPAMACLQPRSAGPVRLIRMRRAAWPARGRSLSAASAISCGTLD